MSRLSALDTPERCAARHQGFGVARRDKWEGMEGIEIEA